MKPNVRLLCTSPDPEFFVVDAARVCYKTEKDSDSRWVPTDEAQEVLMGNGVKLGIPMVKVELGPNDEKLLRKLLKNDHSSTLRFAYAHFHLSNMSIACMNQVTRISHAGILVKSMRYTNVACSPTVSPTDDEWFNEEFTKLSESADDFYSKAIEKGFKKEEARYGKLVGTITEMHLSGNFQMFKHLLSIRLSKKVMKETLLVCIDIAKLLYKAAPIIFENEYDKAIDLEKWLKEK